jgi:hypothetical protein
MSSSSQHATFNSDIPIEHDHIVSCCECSAIATVYWPGNSEDIQPYCEKHLNKAKQSPYSCNERDNNALFLLFFRQVQYKNFDIT